MDPWEIFWMATGLVGLVAIVKLLPDQIRDVRYSYRDPEAIDPIPAWVYLGITLASMVKILICLGIGVYAVTQPPVEGELSLSQVLVRVGFVLMEILVVLPPWGLLWGRQRVQTKESLLRAVRQRKQREESTYTGPERRQPT